MKLLPPGSKLISGICKLYPSICYSLLRCIQLCPSVLQLFSGICKLFFSIFVFFSSVCKLLFSILQILPGVCKFLLCLRLSVGKFLFRICKLFLCLRHDILISGQTAFFLNSFYILLKLFYQSIISVCITCHLIRSMCPNIDLGIYFLIKILRKYIGKTIDFTRAKCCISSVKRYVKRCSSNPRNSVRSFFQKWILGILPEFHLIADLISHSLRKSHIQKTLSAFFRQPSFCYSQSIYIFIY